MRFLYLSFVFKACTLCVTLVFRAHTFAAYKNIGKSAVLRVVIVLAGVYSAFDRSVNFTHGNHLLHIVLPRGELIYIIFIDFSLILKYN